MEKLFIYLFIIYEKWKILISRMIETKAPSSKALSNNLGAITKSA